MSDANAHYVLENIHVLVLDDNRHMRQPVDSILHALGVKQVCRAGDAVGSVRVLDASRSRDPMGATC